ncbi:MAG: hypothetical protein QM780_15820 [Hyphomicrobium sp.]|uniref:hypothetical protein n=1 Tax=Hyphomicrobium sp. TaxID=82 RepID=UPI0039E4DAA9
MAELIVLQDQRLRLTKEQDRLVSQVGDLLKQARSGRIRGLVYASIGGEDDAISLCALNTDDCGTHELVGLSQMLNDWLLAAARSGSD